MSKERGGSLIFFLSGIYGLIFSIQFPMGRLMEPGPGVFPLFLSILLLVSGLLTFLSGRGKRIETKDRSGFVKKWITPLQIVALTVIYILVLERLGYLVTSFLYLFLLLFWVSRYRLWMASGLAVLIGMGSWYFFVRILLIRLPGGVLNW